MLRRALLTIAAAGLILGYELPGQAAPGATADRIAAADKALARGDGIAAEAELRRALDAGAGKPEIAAAMGEALMAQGNNDKALEWLAPGQFAKREQVRGWRTLGILHRNMGNLAASGQAFDRALAANPKDPQVWVEIGRLRYIGGEQLQAIDASQQALSVDPQNPRALEFRAELVRDSLGYAAAIGFYEQALAQAPDDLALLGGYAGALGEAGRAGDMLKVTRRMIAIDPRNPTAFYLQAVLAARVGKIDLARSLFNRTRGEFDSTPAGLLLSGVLDLEAGNANVASEQLIKLADSQGANQQVQLLLAQALYQSHDYVQLFGRFGALAQRGDASPYLLTLLGRALEERGDRAGAAALLDRAAAANIPTLMPLAEPNAPAVLAPRWNASPALPGTAVPYVRSLLGTGNLGGASQVAARYAELRPGSGDALSLKGDVELASGAAVPALQHYMLASQVRFPDLLLLRIGEAYDRLGQGAAAQPLVARYLDAFPGSQLAARMAANRAALAGDWETARSLLESLRARAGGRDFRLLADLGLAQLRSGDSAAALETARRAHALQPSSPLTSQLLGMALVAAGKEPDQARQLLEAARRIGGDNPMLAEARKKLK